MSQVIYKQATTINPAQHLHHRIAPLPNQTFARDLHAVYLNGLEFVQACAEYPIVFTRQAEGIMPVALLGLRPAQNLYLDEKGQWAARYIPAYIRRYPFVLARIEGLTADQPWAVCVDEASPSWNTQTGQALFKEDGSQTEFLSGVIEFLAQFEKAHQRTQAFCAKLEQLGLLTAVDARVSPPGGGEDFVVSGMMLVDEAKLRALPLEEIEKIWRGEEAAWLHAHLFSLSQLQTLVTKQKKA